jgi:hypothetical protein
MSWRACFATIRATRTEGADGSRRPSHLLGRPQPPSNEGLRAAFGFRRILASKRLHRFSGGFHRHGVCATVAWPVSKASGETDLCRRRYDEWPADA